MERALPALLLLFVAVLAVSVSGILVVPSWSPVFGSLAGLAGFGVGLAGYAIYTE